MKKTLSLLFCALLLLASCTPHQQPTAACIPVDDLWGFWGGLWHGIISPITLIIHIFNKSVVVYAVNNTGGWYDFAFLWGVGMSVFGGVSVNKK